MHHVTLHMSPEVKEADRLWNQWNDGPASISDHNSFKVPRSEAACVLWKKLVKRRGKVPVWMLDVPSIARWSSDIEHDLNTRKSKP